MHSEVKRLQDQLVDQARKFEEQMERQRLEGELNQHKAVERERTKWERREERLLSSYRHVSFLDEHGVRSLSPMRREEPCVVEETPVLSSDTLRVTAKEFVPREVETVTRREPSYEGEVSPGTTETLCTGSKVVAVQKQNETELSAPCLSSQLPPIPKFTGEGQGTDGETFQEWLEQFEMVADVCQWNDQTKLVNLTMRLCGPAYSFYRTCSSDQRYDYKQLVQELSQRFTPVRIPAVQSNMFHERKQGCTESVDEYAQDLKCLFYKAYPRSQQNSREAEEMGQSVLGCQFIAGLQPEIKAKLVGSEGSFDVLLTKARFEEAKSKELAVSVKEAVKKTSVPKNSPGSTDRRGSPNGKKLYGYGSGPECYICRMKGHLARDCRYRGRGAPVETRGGRGRENGRSSANQIATVSTQEDEGKKAHRVQELQKELRVAELERALEDVKATLHSVVPENNPPNEKQQLGPTLTVPLELEGMPINALLDTGSPVSIVSLEKLLSAFAIKRPQGQSPDEWETEMRNRFQPPMVTLRNYGGGELSIVGQITASVSCSGFHVDALLQAQPNASVDLLVGTDLLPSLGFALLQLDERGHGKNLLKGEDMSDVEMSSEGSDLKTETKSAENQCENTSSANEETSQKVEGDEKQQSNPTVVHLVTATRIPPRHTQIIKASVQEVVTAGSVLFEPNQSALEKIGVKMDPSMVHMDDHNCIVLAIHNFAHGTVQIAPGQTLGELHAVNEVSVQALEEEITVNAVSPLLGDCEVDDSLSENDKRLSEILDALSLNSSSLSPSQQEQLQALIAKFQTLFTLHSFELGCTDVVQHSIDTDGHPPIKQCARRVPFSLRSTIDKLVDEMLQQGVIKPSKSPWASPVVLVAKKDGSMRFCVDY